jgi:hypothetical protein
MRSDDLRPSNTPHSRRLIVLTEAEAASSRETPADGTRAPAGSPIRATTRKAIDSLLVSSRALRIASEDQRRRAAHAMEKAQMLLRRGRLLHTRVRQQETRSDLP